MAEKPGTLYIVPTPLGNLEDITLRGLRILKEVDFICAEDTRHSRKLLSHFGIGTKLISYYREKEREKSAGLITLLQEGKNLALISDAGTPAISDPGAILVEEAHRAKIKIIPLPGPSAMPTAFSASGIVAQGFVFLGFPPAKSTQRRAFLQQIKDQQLPTMLYESPRRVGALVEEALEILGERKVFWARELTKKHEELLSCNLSQLLPRIEAGVKGELVLIISPGEKEEVSDKQLETILLWHRKNSNASVRDISREISKELGISRSKVYKMALALWAKK